jgi:hypothetical protein
MSIDKLVTEQTQRKCRINPAIAAVELAYFCGASAYLVDHLDSRAMQICLPFYIGATVAGAFLVKEGYSRGATWMSAAKKST